MPLGVHEDATYKELSLEIKPGQLIFIGTDGIRETRNQNDEMFGSQRRLNSKLTDFFMFANMQAT